MATTASWRRGMPFWRAKACEMKMSGDHLALRQMLFDFFGSITQHHGVPYCGQTRGAVVSLGYVAHG